VGAVSLATAACSTASTLSCSVGGTRPVRAVRHALPAGDYRVVAESLRGFPATLTVARRAAAAASFVPGADACGDVVTIPETGGFYRGNTANAQSSYTASCDFATPAGSPDQLLRVVLSEPRRVILDMRGSDYDTLLSVRRGPGCPGAELDRACAVSQGVDRSFLDLDLPAGEYYFQIDGYAGASGAWFLDVFSLPL
jgi:hypothetical protein